MIGDPGDETGEIPILTDAVGDENSASLAANPRALQSAIVVEVLKAADSLLHQAAREIEATLFENVFDRLRAQLPEIIDRVLVDQALPQGGRPSGDD
ncbi:MAG: hypothetical protein KGL92_07750 [Gammaproteobacteria bacterium]|nr:hypothetical protein [Gammaproteobacteria bacterium]MDE2348380.1 hypothetical protein [Gammaproteobacteria bacterium]